jgi:plastocyanin
MAGNQPYSQTPNGDAVWVFKLGGKAVYTTGPQSNPVVVSGSQEAPSPPPINKRRPVDNTAAGIVPPTEIWMARSNGNANSAADSTNTSSMVPSRLTVPLGTTVTFRNPGAETFTTTPNLKEHCATQFFEGKFNFRLQPGQTAQYTFDREGEYFYNDCTDPRPSGKVIVTLAPENAALKIEPQVLNFKGANGVFTGVNGTMQAMITVPAGWTLDKGPVGDPSTGPVIMVTPLTTQTFNAVSTAVDDGVLVAAFNRADIDNNVPSGDTVPLTVTANFLDSNGVQRKLQGTATVKVMK